MDEFSSIAIWLLIILFSVNLGIIYLSAQPTFKEVHPELNIALTNGTYFAGYDYGESNNQAIDNKISSDPISISFRFLSQMANGAIMLFNTLLKLFTAWLDLLGVVLYPLPGGEFFVIVLKPLFGFIEIMGILLLFLRGAGVIRGVI